MSILKAFKTYAKKWGLSLEKEPKVHWEARRAYFAGYSQGEADTLKRLEEMADEAIRSRPRGEESA